MMIHLKELTQKLAALLLILFGLSTISLAYDEFGGRISGTITTSDGQPATWVTVNLEHTSRSVITDNEGFFLFRNLKPGNYTLIVTYAEGQHLESTVEVGDSEVPVRLILELSAKALAHIVIDGRRSPNLQPVSIGKLPVAPMDLPQSFAVIHARTIQDQQAVKLSDVIRNVNGIYLSSTRGSTQETFNGRGYRLGNDNFYKNGARVNSGVYPEMSSLEKIEILKGSAAILFGEVAPGGIINMVTKKPRFDLGAVVSMQAGSYGLVKPMVDVYGPLNKRIAWRLIGAFEDADSYRDVVHSARYYVNPSVLYKVNSKTMILFQADYLNHDFTPDFGIGSLDNTQIADVARNRFNGVNWQYNRIQQATASVSLDHKANSKWDIKASIHYQNYHRDYYSTERIQADANGEWMRPLNKILSDQYSLFGQLNLTGKLNTGHIGHILSGGVDADFNNNENTKFDNPTSYDQWNILNPAKYTARTEIPPARAMNLTTTPVMRAGVFVQDLISVSDRVKVLAGIRWSLQEASRARIYDYSQAETEYGMSNTANAWSPRLGLVYKVFKNTATFASYSNSFSANKGTDVYGNALKPSVIDQYEMGVKNDFLEGALSINLTGYQIVNNNLAQTAIFEKDGVTPNNNTALKELVGQTTSKGLELDITGRIFNGLEVMAGYSFNDMRYTKTPDTRGSYIEGERLVGTPEHTANGSVFYRFDHKLKGLKIGAGVYYTGDRQAGWNNTKGQAQNYSRLIFVSGFTVMDITAGYTIKKVSVLAKISNLMNTYNYYVHENYSINPIPPRQLVTTVSYKF